MLLRALALILCLAAAGWYLLREQEAGHFQRVDELFLDFLLANSRAAFEKTDPNAEPEVVLVRLREEDAAEFAGWPPPPIDWHTLLKSLHAYDADVILISESLNWGRPAPDFLPALAEALLPLPGIVMAVEAHAATAEQTAPPFMGGLEDALPRFQRIDGELRLAPALGALITAPDDLLRRHGQLGLLCPRQNAADGSWRLPYAMREGDTLVPSALAQTLAHYSRTPYAAHRLRLGPGAGAYLNKGMFVPLLANGELVVHSSRKPIMVNALDLMAGTLADGMTGAEKATLKTARIIVIGIDHDDPTAVPSAARMHADVLAHLLALPRIRVLARMEQWLVWSMAVAAAFWIVLGVRRQQALIAGLGLAFAALVASFVAFQSNLLWCPPTIPLALILAGTLAGRVFGRSHKVMAELPPAQP